MLNSLFSNYITSGTSLFFPFLSYSNIIFQFSTGHLIDIIIIINIITFVDRGGYQYYVNVCLKKNYLETYIDPYFLEPQEESSQNSNLIIGLKDDSTTTTNESSVEFNFYQKSRINANKYNSKRGYYSNISKTKQNKLNYLHNSSKKNNQHKINLSIFQQFSTNTLINYHLPSKNNNIFSNSKENIQQEEEN